MAQPGVSAAPSQAQALFALEIAVRENKQSEFTSEHGVSPAHKISLSGVSRAQTS